MQLNERELKILENIKIKLFEDGVILPDMDHEILTAALKGLESFVLDALSKPHENEKKNDA